MMIIAVLTTGEYNYTETASLSIQLDIPVGLLSPVQASSALSKDNGTVLAIPLLSDPYRNCTADNQSGHFILSLVLASQTLEHNGPTSSVLYTYDPTCHHCDRCSHTTIHPVLWHHLYSQDFNACYTDRRCISWLTLCDAAIYGLKLQVQANPTFSAVLVSFSPKFQRVLAIYPLPYQDSSLLLSKTKYVYNVVHRRLSAGVGGFTLQNVYNTANNVSLQLTGDAVGWENSSKINWEVGERMIMRCNEVVWIEPISLNCTDDKQSLSGTVIHSSSPLNVFSNLSPLHDISYDPGFNYNAHLVHQMPERSQWGRTFYIDGTHSAILPEDVASCLVHEVTIVTYSQANKVTLQDNTSVSATELGDPKMVVPGEHYEYRLSYTEAQMSKEIQSLVIRSTLPIMVVYDAYTNTDTPSRCSAAVHYSTLVQPESWFANKQIVVLAHPDSSLAYHYHISIFVPSNKSDLSDIIESEPDELCNGTTLDSYSTQGHPVGRDGQYTLLTYTRTVTNSSATQTRLLLRHADPLVQIGVSVYAYSEDLHYSYSNGYTLGMYRACERA